MQFTKTQVATAVAIFFHLVGLAGILFFKADFFISSTPLNLLLMFALLCYTQKKIDLSFVLFVLACLVIGVGVEMVGTNTGLLFGNYKYSEVLGPGINNVPFIIGVNWFIIIYCCGMFIDALYQKVQSMLPENAPKAIMKLGSVVVDGALLAVFFDWIMEPAAIKLNFWQWINTSDVPFYNYVCWFVISALLLFIFHFAPFKKQNKFAVNLLLIQMMFFLLFRAFL